MTLTEQQTNAAANLLIAYPGACGFDPDNSETIAVYDSLVEKGHAIVLTENDDPQLAGGKRAYRLSDDAVVAHRQLIDQQAEQAEQD